MTTSPLTLTSISQEPAAGNPSRGQWLWVPETAPTTLQDRLTGLSLEDPRWAGVSRRDGRGGMLMHGGRGRHWHHGARGYLSSDDSAGWRSGSSVWRGAFDSLSPEEADKKRNEWIQMHLRFKQEQLAFVENLQTVKNDPKL
ncbi:hypothetical protein HDU83_003090 [Entophlyctis luteolus]|nr:hypothetical protein HDU83_003090 [Entophlyctis luteolus]